MPVVAIKWFLVTPPATSHFIHWRWHLLDHPLPVIMTFRLAHPFKQHADTIDIPKDKQRDVEDIYRWICDQSRYPQFSRNHAYLFLHACLWDVADTKKTIHKYLKIRGSAPDIFDNRDPLDPGIKTIYNITHMVGMPIKTPEGYKVLCYRLSDTDPSKVNFANAVKAFCMFNDMMISQDGIIEGYIVVFDMKGLRLGHLAKIQLGALRTFMAYIQEAHPVRLKKIYVVHAAAFINQVMAILKPLIKSELLGLLQFTSKGPKDLFPLALLPEDYGGTLNTLEKYHNEQRRMLETDYREWLLETNQFKELPKESSAASNNNNNSYSATNHNMSRQNSIKSLGRQNSSSSTSGGGGGGQSSQQKTPEPTRHKYKSAMRGLKNLEID